MTGGPLVFRIEAGQVDLAPTDATARKDGSYSNFGRSAGGLGDGRPCVAGDRIAELRRPVLDIAAGHWGIAPAGSTSVGTPHGGASAAKRALSSVPSPLDRPSS